MTDRITTEGGLPKEARHHDHATYLASLKTVPCARRLHSPARSDVAARANGPYGGVTRLNRRAVRVASVCCIACVVIGAPLRVQPVSTPTPTPATDDYEPDNSLPAAKPIACGSTQSHTIVPDGDVD